MDACERRVTFPFSAMVGLEKAKLALLCVAVDPLIGGVLLKGDKGTGKSTLVRALASVLPEIEVVADCPFNCNPHNPLEMCDNCYERLKRGETLPVGKRKMRVVNLPLSVTIDRVVGTVDVERFLKEGRKHLQPGILAEANGGILYIDEVNLLDDYIADCLLDAAAMGWNLIEREGVSFRHPSRFILVGSMNPEEGDLRPQILDRFGLCVEVSAPESVEERMEIARRVEEFHKNPQAFWEKFEEKEKNIAERVTKARDILPEVEISNSLMELLAETVIKLGIRTNRAEIVTVKTAKAIAALDGRRKVSVDDLKRAMELALPHRIKDRPFGGKPPSFNLSGNNDSKKSEEEGREKSHGGGTGSNPTKQATGEGGLETRSREAEVPDPDTEKIREAVSFSPRSSRDSLTTVVGLPKGIPISYTLPTKGERKDIDPYCSAVWAILNGKKPPIRIGESDIRVRIRKAKVPTLWVIVLDSSGSMFVRRRINIAKGIARRLVEDGYLRRSKVALIVARGKRANVHVAPTKNYWRLLEEIESVPTGGRTPLSSALLELSRMASRERAKERSLKVKAFLITDGRANVSLFGGGLREEIANLARALAKQNVSLSVFFTGGGGINPGLCCVSLLVNFGKAKVYSL